jgi:branched-chain amino acid transport system substrate-binding protein
MADFFAEKLGVKAIYVLDDQGAYGVGLADAFQKQIATKGVKVLGRDQLDPKASDYSAILTKIKSMNADSLYYGGVGTAGVKLIKQSYDILPNIKKGGGDGIYGGDLLKGAGFPAIEGWYATIAAPHLVEDKKLAAFMEAFKKKYGAPAEDYSITAYDAASVIIDAIKTVAATGKPVTREAVRDAIQAGKYKTLQGDISFDANGDLNSKVVSVFQVKKNDAAPLDDTNAQFKYIGVAPTS